MFYSLASLYFLIFNFTVNPTLSPVRDWDLLSLAALPTVFLVFAALHRLFDQSLLPRIRTLLVGFTLALGIFSFSYIGINAGPVSASRRLEGTGTWVFRSYYNNAGYMLHMSAKMIPDLGDQIHQRERTIDKLLPLTEVPDPILAFLYHKLASALYQNRQFDSAGVMFARALQNDPYNASAIKMMGVIAIQQWRFNEALRILSYYNCNINGSALVDRQGLELEEEARRLVSLSATPADSLIVQRELEQLYLTMK